MRCQRIIQETRQVVQDALLLKAAGLEVKAEEISEKNGYSLTQSSVV